MNYLVVYAHPNPKSFCHAIKEQIVAQIQSHGSECVVRDLYQMGFNPVLSADDFMKFREKTTPADIQAEQDYIRKADVLIFVHPIWWFSMPAILKGYVDRVFSRGFAYDMKGHIIQGLLKGKKAMMFTTTGGPRIAYYLLGYWLAIKAAIGFGIFNFCGIKMAKHQYFYSVPTVTNEVRTKMLEAIKKIKF